VRVPHGDQFLYVVSGTIELILDDGDERTVGVETRVVLRAAYVVPRGVWHQLESIEPTYLVHVTPDPNGGHRPRGETLSGIGRCRDLGNDVKLDAVHERVVVDRTRVCTAPT
jgi:hypothetical protein